MVMPSFGSQSGGQQSEFPFPDLLEMDTQGMLSNLLGRIGGDLTQPQQSFATQTLFPQLQNQFFGALGEQILGGGAPTLTFSDFLDDNLDFTAQFRRQSPTVTGRNTQGLVAPTGRFLFSF